MTDFGSVDSGSTPGEAIAHLGHNSTHDSLQFQRNRLFILYVMVQDLWSVPCLLSFYHRLYYNKPRLSSDNNNKLVQSFLGNKFGAYYYFYKWSQ